MTRQRTLGIYGLLFLGLLAGAVSLAALNGRAVREPGTASGQVATPSSTSERGRGWENKPPEEIGRHAAEWLLGMKDVRSGTPEVLLTMPVRDEDPPGLGVGCPIGFDTYEEPPLMLVILKGDFLPQSSLYYGLTASHVALVYDLWAGQPVRTVWSDNGSRFRVALGDSALPTPFMDFAGDCSSLGPVAKTHHYGEPAPPTPQPSTTPLNYVPPRATISPANLLGRSPQEVAQFAVDTLVRNGEVTGGTPQVLLARSVEYGDYEALGLGCMPTFAAIEEPPLVLVILEGNFQLHLRGRVNHLTEHHYVAFVYDLWAGFPASVLASGDKRPFAKALNDPSLPTQEPQACSTQEPYPKTFHYGETVPGIPVPPPPPQPPPGETPQPAPTINVPEAPQPVETAGKS
jgi:hypothetical protein